MVASDMGCGIARIRRNPISDCRLFTSVAVRPTPGNNAGSSLAIAPPLEPVPVAAEPKILPLVQDKALAATAPVIAPAATPVLAKQGAHAAPPRTAKFTDKRIARATRKSTRINGGKAAPVASETPEAPLPRPTEPVAPAKTPCSEAARALALCNTN